MMAGDIENELKRRLLPRPPTPPAAALPLRPTSPGLKGLVPGRPVPSGPLDLGLSKKKVSVRSWIRIDGRGNTQLLEANKGAIMRRCELPARDLRLLDPVFVYPSTILGREKAIVVNLEQIRCIITAEEVLLLNTSNDSNSTARYVEDYKNELQRRLTRGNIVNSHDASRFAWRGTGGQAYQGEEATASGESALSASDEDNHQNIQRRVLSDMDMFSGGGGVGEDLPFEFLALEVALEAACSYLDQKAREVGREAYPLLEQLAYHISTRNLELVRKLKSTLVALTRRVQKVRDEIEQLMDDDGDMAEMYLTEKKRLRETSFAGHPDIPTAFGSLSTAAGQGSFSAPVSPVGSPRGGRGGSQHGGGIDLLDRQLSYASQHGSSQGSVSNVEELEMLLEAYFVVVDGTLNKLTALSQYIEDTEDFINIQLDNVRNQLIQFELLLTTATFVVAIYGVVAGIFGMNIPIGLEEDQYAFKWVCIITGVAGLAIFGLFLWYFKYKNLNIV